MGAPSEYPMGFGNYVLLQAMAHGGMGEVYLAKHGGLAGLDRLCVLKKLRPDLTENDEYVRRFIDEARVVVALNHANIANVFDVGRVREEYYLAMEHVAGVNVRAIQNRSREINEAIPEGIATYVTGMALEALDYAHRLKHPMTGQPLNLVHRDVSPQNVMVSYEGEVKLIDFGLAASELKEEQTESQVVMGKVAYMSPEQARGEPVLPATDQFAMGIFLYELIVGERFYGEMNNYEIWQVVGRGGFVPRRWTDLNPELAAILARALDGDPKARFESCGDFYDALHAFQTKHHPSVNQRVVRKFMARLFADDHERYIHTLQSFHDVSAASFQSPQERAQTVSLVNPLAGLSDDEIKDLHEGQKKAEQSANVFAAPSTDPGPATLVDAESQAPPTLVEVTAAQAATPSVAASDATALVDRAPNPARLMRAAEIPGAGMLVDSEVSMAVVTSNQRLKIALVAMAIVLLFAVGVVGFILLNPPAPTDPVAGADPPKSDPAPEDPKDPVVAPSDPVDPPKDPPTAVEVPPKDPVTVAKKDPQPKTRRTRRTRKPPVSEPVEVTPPAPSGPNVKVFETHYRAIQGCEASCVGGFAGHKKPALRKIWLSNSSVRYTLEACAVSCR